MNARKNVTGIALGFFTSYGIVNPFSADLSGFCRSFRVQIKTAIEFHIDRDVLLINEVHMVFEWNSVFDFFATIWNTIIYWTQNGL